MAPAYDVDSEDYCKTNRESAMTAKRTKYWCLACDEALVSKTSKCPACGFRQNPRKRKGV